MAYLIFMISVLFSTNSSALDNDWRVTKILSGDTGVITSHDQKSVYFHLVGCEVFSPHDPYGRQAVDFLTKQLMNQMVDVLFISQKSQNLNKDLPEHNLVQIRLNQKDICTEELRVGLADFRKSDEASLRAISSAGMKIAQQSARAKSLGIWTRARNGNYASTPASALELQQYKYGQAYINGTNDPTKENFDRPSTTQSPSANKNNESQDWRKKIGTQN